MEEAVASYREALRLRSDWPEASNQLAWILATSPQDELRNGAEAERIAGAALKTSELREPMLIDTVAAALAEAGNFDKAIEIQKEAIVKAKALGDPKLVAELEKHAEAYEKKQPFRDSRLSPSAPPPAQK
jgi:hypothetical protein